MRFHVDPLFIERENSSIEKHQRSVWEPHCISPLPRTRQAEMSRNDSSDRLERTGYLDSGKVHWGDTKALSVDDEHLRCWKDCDSDDDSSMFARPAAFIS